MADASQGASELPLVAVLELRQRLKGSDKEAVDAKYFANLVPSGILNAAPAVRVMTQENMLVLLQAAGTLLQVPGDGRPVIDPARSGAQPSHDGRPT